MKKSARVADTLDQVDPFPRRRVAKTFAEEGGAIQAPREQVNINAIVKRFEETGIPPQMREGAHFDDFTTAQTLHEALNIVMDAQAGFYGLPAGIRETAWNSPLRFAEMLEDDEGRRTLASAGLAIEVPAEDDLPPSEQMPRDQAPDPAEPPEGGGENTSTT